ncbi:zinc-binding dehydrogenase [Microbacterium sp. BWT-B31]|uniref:zinc-dependent alcohol dehydrogenase n=1 Tax=Microbacterium sp. BWT-B31 TaxID=3232072 RepID=UPI00352711F6
MPEPEIGPYDVLVETLAAGVCGTDRHIVEGTFYRSAYPAIVGHETLGRVVQTGKDVRYLTPGSLVLRTTAVRPGEQLGEWHSMLGGFAELAVATDVRALTEDGRADLVRPYDRMQRTVPGDFDPLDAGAFIVFKETLSWLRTVGDVAGRRLVVIGTGGAALMFIQIARSLGARQVIVVGRRQERLQRAKELGADGAIVGADDTPTTIRELTDGEGADLVIDAAGATATLEAIPDALAHGGTLAVYGLSVGQSATFRWGWDRSTPRDWTLRFAEPDEAGIHDEALALLSSQAVDLKSILTDVVAFSDAATVLDVMNQPTSAKVAIDFQAERDRR